MGMLTYDGNISLRVLSTSRLEAIILHKIANLSQLQFC